MRPTRKIIAEFIAVFSIGALAGGLVTWSYTGTELSDMQFPPLRPTNTRGSDTPLSTFMSRTNDPDTMVTRISKKYADEYHLTPDELNKIQPIISQMAERTYEERRQFGLDIMATLDENHHKIAEQLTPEHRLAYERAIADHRKKLNSMLLLDQSSSAEEPK